MKLGKLLDQAAMFLSPERRAREIKKKKLKTLLEEMKQHERELAEQLEHDPVTAQEEGLELKRKILHEQRKKGVRLLKQLKKEGASGRV